MKLSEKIIKIRKENGLSQEEFGNKINVSRQAVSKWENEEATPDTEKIQEIVKKFNVSYEYLLDDKIETIGKNTNIEIKSKKKGFLKIIIIVLLIYILICVYKFISFYRFYTISNSFSEENYWIAQTQEILHGTSMEEGTIIFDTTKIENKILEKSYSLSNTIKDENGKKIPYLITYTDIDKKIAYNLYYNEEIGKYEYNDIKDDMINDNEIDELFVDKNIVKENTMGHIPSNLKDIFLASINPMYYYVDIVNHEIRLYSITDRVEKSVKLSKDYLVENVFLKTKEGKTINITYSYDYVQDHLKNIEDPIETYKDKIIYEKE